MVIDDESVQAIKLVAYLKFLRIITCLRYMDRLKEVLIHKPIGPLFF